jgi:hypothetical protein
METSLLGYDPLLTTIFMSSVSISFLAFIRSHWSYIHITLSSGLVAAAHRQSAVRTVRTILILDITLFVIYPPISIPIALIQGRNSFNTARWLLFVSNAIFWFHAIVSVPLFFFYQSLVRTIDKGLAMKKSDPAMLDLRGRLQSLRRRQFSTIIGALIWTISTHATDDVVIATWAYAWAAAHLLLSIGLTGYAFFYWSPSAENLGIARQVVAMPTGVESKVDTYLYTPNDLAAARHTGKEFVKPLTLEQQHQQHGDTNPNCNATINDARGSIVASSTIVLPGHITSSPKGGGTTTLATAAAAVAAAGATRGHTASSAITITTVMDMSRNGDATPSDQQLVASIEIAPPGLLARIPTSRNLHLHNHNASNGHSNGHSSLMRHIRHRTQHHVVAVDVVAPISPAASPPPDHTNAISATVTDLTSSITHNHNPLHHSGSVNGILGNGNISTTTSGVITSNNSNGGSSNMSHHTSMSRAPSALRLIVPSSLLPATLTIALHSEVEEPPPPLSPPAVWQ